ncbi:MAG: FliA/WhiG family RNA polymerase sigma factor [Acidobacteria bacterium]|nr:FliA/WhiG family RNA polymerase sigma factor [Acidobacteriota bacterium]
MSATELVPAGLVFNRSSNPLDQIVSDSLPTVRFLASRLAIRLPAHVDVEDLVQVGLIGLLQSANRFDPQRGVQFRTYASRRVQGAMLDYLRSLDWKPRSVRRRSRRLAKACQALRQRLGSNITTEDLAAEIGITPLEVHQWIQECLTTETPMTRTFPQNTPEENAHDALKTMADPKDSPETILQKEQSAQSVKEAIDLLPGNERTGLSLVYSEQLPRKKSGELLGVKQARISQLHRQALQRLRPRLQSALRSMRPKNLSASHKTHGPH